MIKIEIDKGILELEKRVGVSENFFLSLKTEDDWSFIIKLHVLFEAVCSHILLFHFRQPEATNFFSRIELNGDPVGKLNLLRQIGLLSTENKRLISRLSELRNMLVHDVKNAEFDLQAYFESLDDNQKRSFAVAFSPYEAVLRKISPITGIGAKDVPLPEGAELSNVIKRASENPKFHIWIGAYNALVSLVDMYSYSDYLQWEKAKGVIYSD